MNSRAATQVLDAGWRAAAYCLHPRVIGWSLLPFGVVAVLGLLVGWLFWDPAVTTVRMKLEEWAAVEMLLNALDRLNLSTHRSVLAPLVLVLMVAPVLMALSLVIVVASMTPSLVKLIAERRFPGLVRKRGGSLVAGLVWMFASTLTAVCLMVMSIPLWLIPGVIMVLPPLIWGWLNYRVFTYDVLAEHASKEERRQILLRHRVPLLLIGVGCGYLGAMPSLVFTFGAVNVILAPLLVPIAVWLYTLVFAFGSLWFGHYALTALQSLRSEAVSLAEVALPETVQALPPSKI